MSKAIVSESKLTALADAIRTRFGVGGELTLDEMAETVMPSLPDTYQQVDYIQSSGTQYIDTGVPITADLRMVLERANVNTNDCIEGAIYNRNTPFSIFSWANNGATNGCFGSLVGSDSSAWLSSGVPIDTNKHTVDLASGSQKLDGTEYGTRTIQPNSLTIGLFGWHTQTSTNPSWTTGFSARVYSAKFWQGVNMIRNLIPCYRKSDSVIGLYDLINGQFYTNAGSGAFTKGADINEQN